MTVSIKCKECGKEYKFDITKEQYNKYISGEYLITDIFPEISSELREMFISRICPDCWNKIFSEYEE